MKTGTEIIRVTDLQAWDNFVDSHPFGTLFQKSLWLKNISPDIEITGVINRGVLIGGLALVKTRKFGISGYHIPPYTPCFSPLIPASQDPGNYSSEAFEILKAIISSITITGHCDFQFPLQALPFLPFYWNGFLVEGTLTYRINTGFEEYHRSLNANKKREIAKTEEETEQGKFVLIEDPDPFIIKDLVSEAGKANNFNPRTDLIMKICRAGLNRYIKIFCLKNNSGTPVSAAVLAYDNKTVYNLINASTRKRSNNSRSANLYVLFKGIEFALKSNRIFDFEGSRIEGVEFFFRLLGGKPYPLYRVQKSGSLIYSLLRAAGQIKNDRKKQ